MLTVRVGADGAKALTLVNKRAAEAIESFMMNCKLLNWLQCGVSLLCFVRFRCSLIALVRLLLLCALFACSFCCFCADLAVVVHVEDNEVLL